jgi:hypothetical protein
VPIDNVYLPFAAGNFYTAQRVTEVHEVTDFEYKQRIARGLYRDADFIRSTLDPEQTGPEKANDKIEGKSMSDNVDGLRNIYHVYTWLELEDDTRSDGEMAPYIMMIDGQDHEMLGLYRNWEDGDETMTKLDWLVEFKFIPWRGAYAVGLPHLIGGMSAALTGSLRALLDTAHINNSATMMKLKGGKISGQSDQIDVTQVIEIEGAPGVDDVRKIAMPLPFNPPSQVLMELLGWLTTQAKGVVTTAEEKIADVNANAPVGTTQALIEQGSAVFSSIHARLHESQKRVLMILGRINRWYLEGRKLDPYELMNDPKQVDQLFAMASQHVSLDAEETLQGITPVIQNIVQLAQKYKQKPNLTPDGQVLLETSMAETKRRAARDQAEMQIKSQTEAQRLQMEREKMEQEYEMKMEEQDLKIALALGDQEMEERIEAARLSRDAARLKLDQDKVAQDLMKGM